MMIAVSSVWLGARLWRRFRRTDDEAEPVIDYRIVALGALFPDAIDKPLAMFGLDSLSQGETSGHTIAHTLLASGLIIATGLVLSRRGDHRLLWFGLGSLTHPLVDPVIVYPRVLLWPAFGWDFPHSHGIPGSYLRIGDAILVAAGAIVLARSHFWRKHASRFIRSGRSPLASPTD